MTGPVDLSGLPARIENTTGWRAQSLRWAWRTPRGTPDTPVEDSRTCDPAVVNRTVPHIVLLGDSIFDNAAYVGDQPAVDDRLRACLPADWQVTLCARDGSVINDVHAQLARLPHGASHLVLSVGGNDLLGEAAILGKAARTIGEGLALLAVIQDRFLRDYERLLKEMTARALPTLLCTIYDPWFPDPALQREAVAALCLFNDVILRHAHHFGVPILDLRRICTGADDYATPIEPSTTGGAKIARAIREVVLGHDFGTRRAVIFP